MFRVRRAFRTETPSILKHTHRKIEGAIAERNEAKDHLWQAISQLNEKHREVIILRHFQDLSYEQIAQIIMCAKGTVMSRLYHARKELKNIMDQQKGGQKQ